MLIIDRSEETHTTEHTVFSRSLFYGRLSRAIHEQLLLAGVRFVDSHAVLQSLFVHN